MQRARRSALRGVVVTVIPLLVACGQSRRAEPDRDAVFLTEQLAALELLAAPKGVAAETWRDLQHALSQAIEQRLQGTSSNARIALAAPVTEGARINLTLDLDLGTLRWDYRNPGDYDQNGEVSISDLSALAPHLGESVSSTPGGENSIVGVVDGDGNGLITIADITPLGASLGRRITGFNLYEETGGDSYPEAPSDPSTLPSIASVPLSAYEGSRNTERIRFSFVLSEVLSYYRFWVRPLDAVTGLEGISSTLVDQTLVTGPPVAALYTNNFEGSAPLAVSFSATDSRPVGVLYSFDPEGDGQFTPFTDHPYSSHTFTEPGSYDAAVRVLEPGGLFDTAIVTIKVAQPPQWLSYYIPKESYLAGVRFITLGEHDFMPHVVYGSHHPDLGYDMLISVNAMTRTGSNWGRSYSHVTSLELHFSPQAQLIQVESLPAALVDNTANGRLRLARPYLSFPGDWTSAPIVETAAPFSGYSGELFSELLGVAYHDNVADNLKYRQALDDDVDLWGPDQIVTAGTNLGRAPALAKIDFAPAIAYLDDNGIGSLRYVSADRGSGPNWSWNAPLVLSNGQSTFDRSLLRLDDGSPAVVFHNLDAGVVMCRRATDASGVTWAPPDFAIIATTASQPALVPRAVMVGGVAHAYWHDPASGALMHSNATDETALDWTAPDQVASGVSSTVPPYPASLFGRPAVAFSDLTDTALRIAIFY